MPIKYRINHKRRLVIACGIGDLKDLDFFDYQRTVWARSDVAGYDEVVDMTLAGTIESPTATAMRELANLSAKMAAIVSVGKTAIVAPKQLFYGLGRMYEVYRSLQPGNAKEVAVVRSLDEASSFLGIKLLASDIEEAQTKKEEAS